MAEAEAEAEAPASDPPARPPLPLFRALIALLFIGVGVYLIATANKPTETVTARVSYSVSYTHADTADFEFADGSSASESEPGTLVDAVRKYGPGPARVTRNAENDSIYKVVFHDKRYTLSDPGGDRATGIVAIVLGALWLAWLILTAALPPAPAAPDEEPAPTRE